MAGIGSPRTYIKEEPDEMQFDPYRSIPNGNSNYNQFGNQFGSWHGGIDPSSLNLSGGLMRPSFGSQQNLSTSFIAGSSGIADDELEDLIHMPPESNNSPGVAGQNHYQNFDQFNGLQDSSDFNQNYGNSAMNGSAQIPTNQHSSYHNHMYSHTPEGNPVHSPFEQSFDYSRWHPMQQQRRDYASQSLPASNFPRSGPHDINPRKGRTSTDARSPMTPRMSSLSAQQQLGTPDSSNFSGRPIQGGQTNQAHRKSSSMQLESPGSGNSYVESPISSPQNGPVHVQISGLMKGVKPASLPAKVEHAAPSHPATTLEAKRQKRRQSHNAVERRRRDNINDRITDLSRLVPQHRLDDDRIRKQLSTTSAIPQGMGGSMSPPPPTSLLASSAGRRAAGSITQGLPLDDKDKGPPKGDVLNGAVTWMRDLMWMLYKKLNQEDELINLIKSLGGESPFGRDENEQRMKSELLDSIERNEAANFEYSRRDGTGLYVPQHTDHSGASLEDSQTPQDFQNTFQHSSMGTNHMMNDPDFDESLEPDVNGAMLDFKEEDDYGMDVG